VKPGRLFILFIGFIILTPTLSGQGPEFTEKKAFRSQTTYLFDAQFSPFRNYFALTYGDNTIEVYDKNWRKVFESQGNPKAVAGRISFSPDENFLAFSKYRSTTDIAILRLSDMKVVQVLSGNSVHVNTLTWSHDGRFLACGGQDYSVKIWIHRGDKLVPLQEIHHFEDPVRRVAFSFDDSFLGYAGDNEKIFLLKRKDDKYVLADSIYNARGYIHDFVFHPSRMELAVAYFKGIKVWRYRKSHFVPFDSITDKADEVHGMSFSPTGEFLAGARYSDIHLWKTGEEKYVNERTLYRHSAKVFNIAFSDDGKFMTSTSSDRSAIIWEVSNIHPSSRSVVASYLHDDLTTAQKQILTSDVLQDILKRLDPTLIRGKDEFETTAAFNQRREKLAKTTLGYLQEHLEKKYHIRPAPDDMVKIDIQNLIGYNADKEIYKIRFMETEAGVEIPIEAARQLKSDWQKAYILAWKYKDKQSPFWTYSGFKLKHPVNGNTYPVTPLENPFGLRSETGLPSGRTITPEKTTPEPAVPAGIPVSRSLIFATNVYDAFAELINPVLDARSLSAELSDNYGMIVELVENPTLDETIKKIREYARMTYGPEDQLFIFFAGHGMYDPVFKEGYIISRDAKPDDETKTSYLSHSNLRTMVNHIPCNHIFLAMDVCFGGTFDPLIASTSRAAGMYEDISPDAFIKRKSKYKTRLYLTSGGKVYVPDGRPGHHSPFMRKFLEALRSYGGSDGILTVNEILPYIEKVNPQPRFGEFGDNEPGSDFLFVVKK